ncbi:MAG: hypothetical protein JXA77_08080 [Bacteroidales bacterium]|nr:hypothetical protein [Bacteroidales bacterium]MBN2818589.1 hypothetical protein [Bacteroidales bacterium]
MKSNRIYLTFIAICLIVAGIISSCEEQDFTYSGPSIVSFTDASQLFLVQDIANAVDTVKIGVTKSEAADRTVNISVGVGGSAIEGTHFKLSSTSITIPANQVIGNILIQGLYDGFGDNLETVIFDITGGDVEIANFDTSFTLMMQRYCPPNPDAIVGTYTAVTNGESPDGITTTGYVHTITITETAVESEYEISAISFGLFDLWYSEYYDGGDVPGTILDNCGTYTIVNTMDPWDDTITGSLTINGDGTLTVVGGNTYGDSWTAVLTKN